MKKLVLSAAILLGSLSSFATTTIEPSKTAAQEVLVNEEYKEIAVAALPDAVTASVEAALPGAVIEKAYANEAKEYKLEVKSSDQSLMVYTDANGTIVNK